MTTPKHPTRVIYHHAPASLPAELHAQYEVRPCPPPPDPTFLADSALGGVDSHTLPVPLPDFGPGRLVRDDAACGWRFERAL